jgi:hypothetical protein
MSDKAKSWRWVASQNRLEGAVKRFSKKILMVLLKTKLFGEDGLVLEILLDSGHEGILLLLTVVKLTRF